MVNIRGPWLHLSWSTATSIMKSSNAGIKINNKESKTPCYIPWHCLIKVAYYDPHIGSITPYHARAPADLARHPKNCRHVAVHLLGSKSPQNGVHKRNITWWKQILRSDFSLFKEQFLSNTLKNRHHIVVTSLHNNQRPPTKEAHPMVFETSKGGNGVAPWQSSRISCTIPTVPVPVALEAPSIRPTNDRPGNPGWRDWKASEFRKHQTKDSIRKGDVRFLKLSHRAPKASQGIRLPKNHHSPVNSMLQDDDVFEKNGC